MKKIYLITLVLLFIALSCEDDASIDTKKNTYLDDISDITFINNSFYTTNYDLSGNAGNQIDLIVLGFNENGSFLDDSFPLELNGQGYFSITNDGTDLYLQSRTTQLIFKSSAIGELSYTKYDSIGTHWLPSGLAYHSSNDSIITLYKNQNLNKQYRLRLVSKDISESSHRDELFEITDIDNSNIGIFSLSHHNSSLYMLAFKENEDALITMDYNDLTVLDTEMIGDSTVVGIAILDNSIYLSYRDRRIEKFKDLY
tara:strand:+ start:111 stop:878 length:768 start_codon:yes stop_codon:yes gene_type:complete